MAPLIALVLTACTSGGLVPLPETGDSDVLVDTDRPDTAIPDTDLPEPPEPEGLCALDLVCGQGIPDEPKIPCTFTVTKADGRVDYSGSAGVEVRGRSSSGFPKHQYSVELWDAYQAEQSANLLGMGAESDWIVNGAYIDRALQRNKFGFDLFADLGGASRYASESHACLLTLDGNPQGVYFLAEKVKADDDRVRIDTTAGGFVVGLDDAGGIDNSAIGYGSWEIVSPGQPTPAEIAAITIDVQDWQRAVAGGSADIFTYLDIDSAVDLVLLEELVKNNDGYYLSLFLWKDADGKLFFVPWDLDLSLGQPTYNNNAVPTEWILYRPAMIANMGAVPEFKEKLSARWRLLREGPWSDDRLLGRIQKNRDVLGDELYHNFEIWPWEGVQQVWPTLPDVTDPDAEYERIRNWLPRRTAWIDENIDAW